jgi:DNA-binding NarL/FixJ family response regulator
MRLALVDDERVFRDGMRAILSGHADLEVVGEAGDARSAFSVVASARPDVVVLEVSLPGIDGIAAARELKTRAPESRTLILSRHRGEDFVARALHAGACGYACKAQPATEVLEAIRTVGRGDSYLPPGVSRFVLDDLLRRRRRAPDGPLGHLSIREREIFALLIRDLTNDEIARQLCISGKTVQTHRARILKKLHLHSIVQLVRFAAVHGLLLD